MPEPRPATKIKERAQGRAERRPHAPPERLSLAPTLTPLLVGFVLLIGLVLGLGHLSRERLSDVTRDALDLERRHSGTLSRLLGLQVALIKLNNEARARARVEGNAGLLLPFNFRMRGARREVEDGMKRFENLPYAKSEQGVAFRQDVENFLAATQDPNRYSREGFESFQKIESGLDNFLEAAKREHELIPEKIEASENAARSRIKLLTILAVLTGSLVAAGATWEVQRRFRQIRRSLEDVRRERHFNAQMLEGMVSAIVAVDREGLVRSANAAFLELFPGASVGTSVHDKLATPDAAKVLQIATASRVERSTYRGRWALPHGAGGTPRSFDVYTSPLEIEGQPGHLLTFVDVTEAAEAEAGLRRQESLAAVGRAAAQVSHEIKNPLGSIRLGVAMLRDMTDSREAHSTIDLVERGIEHLNKLTVDVTQFSRRKELTFTEVDLSELIDDSLDLVADKLQQKRTRVEKRYGEAAISAEADADQLRQVFVNLIANAVDASQPEAPIVISIERVSGVRSGGRGEVGDNGGGKPEPTSFARIKVEDRGAGMDEATRARVFEPFFTTKKRGTGLGLAVAKQIVEQHEGRIGVESAPHEGTKFTVDLPLEQRS